MTDSISKPKTNKLGIKKARDNRGPFLIVDVNIWDNLSPYALKVYGQLRKLIDFKLDHDEVDITVESLAIRSGISERKTYQVLNELEKEHFLIQRIKNHHWRYGQTNSYDVAQTYGFFKHVEETHEKTDDNTTVQDLPTPAQYAGPTAQYAGSTAQYAVPYKNQQSFQKSSHVCGEASPPTQHTIKKLKKEKAEQKALEDPAIQELFTQKFQGRNVTLEEMFEACRDHYAQKSTWATRDKFKKWVARENPENYLKIDSHEGRKKVIDAAWADYSLYLSQFRNDRDFLKLAHVQGKEPMTFEEWKCQRVKNASA